MQVLGPIQQHDMAKNFVYTYDIYIYDIYIYIYILIYLYNYKVDRTMLALAPLYTFSAFYISPVLSLYAAWALAPVQCFLPNVAKD